MKKFLLIIIAFFLIAAGKAQRGIDGITFMENKQEAMKELINRFGQPVSEVGNKVVFKNVLFNGDKYSEADVFFNGDSCLYIIRLRTICKSRPKAIEHMKTLWKKYAEVYSTTEGMNAEDGRFVVGYDKDGTRFFTIATFRNSCELSFGPF